MAAAEAQIARLDAVHEARMAEAKKRRDQAMEFLDPTENANVFWQVRENVPQPLLLEQNNQSGWEVGFFGWFESETKASFCPLLSPSPCSPAVAEKSTVRRHLHHLSQAGAVVLGHTQPPSSQTCKLPSKPRTPSPWWVAKR